MAAIGKEGIGMWKLLRWFKLLMTPVKKWDKEEEKK